MEVEELANKRGIDEIVISFALASDLVTKLR